MAEELWKVPEAVAKDFVGIDANRRDAAKAIITRALLVALTSKYIVQAITGWGRLPLALVDDVRHRVPNK